jgi:hypothetical protein
MRLLRGYLVMTVCMVVVEVAPLTLLHRCRLASSVFASWSNANTPLTDCCSVTPGWYLCIRGQPAATCRPSTPEFGLTVPHQSGLALRIVFQAGSIPHVDTELLLNG